LKSEVGKDWGLCKKKTSQKHVAKSLKQPFKRTGKKKACSREERTILHPRTFEGIMIIYQRENGERAKIKRTSPDRGCRKRPEPHLGVLPWLRRGKWDSYTGGSDGEAANQRKKGKDSFEGKNERHTWGLPNWEKGGGNFANPQNLSKPVTRKKERRGAGAASSR